MTAISQGKCPARSQLIDWFDGLLEPPDAEQTERHLDGCQPCRRVLLEWSTPAASPGTAPSAECLDEETLVAYAGGVETVLPRPLAEIEIHLQHCVRCVGALQDLMRQPQPVEAVADPEPVVDTVVAASPAASVRAAAVRWLERIGDLFTPRMWPRAAWAVGVLVLAIGVSRFVGSGGEYSQPRSRSAERVTLVEVTADTAGYARPSADEPIVLQLARGARGRRLETAGMWTRIELADGRRVWLQSEVVVDVPKE